MAEWENGLTMPDRAEFIAFLSTNLIDIDGLGIITDIQSHTIEELYWLENATDWLQTIRALKDKDVPPAMFIFLGAAIYHMRHPHLAKNPAEDS